MERENALEMLKLWLYEQRSMIRLRLGISFILSIFLISGTHGVMAQQEAVTPAVEPPASPAETEQKTLLEQFLPRTSSKLVAQQEIRVLGIGDSMIGMFGYESDSANALNASAGVFLQKLADQHRLTGGVRWVNAKKRGANKLVPLQGTEIVYECHAFQGKGMAGASDMLHTFCSVSKQDLVIAAFGVNDAISGVSLESFRRSILSLIAQSRVMNVELLLVGPHVLATDPPEAGMALTRPYADLMREVAAKQNVLFVDLGDLSRLIQLDDTRDPQLLPVKPTAEVLANPSPIVSPFADEQNPDLEIQAARIFSKVALDYRKYFDHGAHVDWVHPSQEFHRVLGNRIYDELTQPAPSKPWEVMDASFVLEGGGHGTLHYTLKNLTDEDLKITLLPLIIPAWSPSQLPNAVEVPAKQEVTIHIEYTKTPLNHHRVDTYVGANEPMLRLPVIHIAGAQVRMDDVRSVITPLNVLWQNETEFNVENRFELLGEIHNSSAQPISGTWNAIWQGQALKGNFRLEAGNRTVVKLDFEFPKDPSIRRLLGTLGFTVQIGSKSYVFDRQVELVRNLGLGERLPLVMNELSSQELAPEQAAPKAKVFFEALADEKALHLHWDVEGVELDENTDEQLSLVTETSFDARSYGKRLLPGAAGMIRAGSKDRDGFGAVDELAPWAFGSEYAMQYDRRGIHAQLSTLEGGARRFSVSIPRSYFYLHEWSLGNGNSQIGINTALQLWRTGLTSQKGAFVPFRLSPNSLSREDAQSLVPLELTPTPTKRWTVRFY